MDKNSKIIDGKELARRHEEVLKEKVNNLLTKPRLAAILIGNDPASALYINLKEKKAKELGVEFEKYLIPVRTSFEDTVRLVMSLNGPEGPNGIMIQLPLPEEFLQGHQAEELLQLIDPEKDVDGLNYARKGTPHSGLSPSGSKTFVPAAVGAVMSILRDEDIVVAGKHAVVVGASDLVGKPVAKELEKMGAEVEICNSKTFDLKSCTQKADILVSAVGSPGLIRGDMVKDGVVVIDVGTEKVDGKLKGDVDFESVAPKASKITPVPGGVGPMTVITLMENVVEAVICDKR